MTAFFNYYLKLSLPAVVLFGFFFFNPAVSSAVVEAEAPQAHSAEGAASSEHGGHIPLNFADFSNENAHPLVALFFNFALLVVIIYLIMRKPLGTRFKDRKESLVKALKQAEEAKKAAEEALAEARQKIESVDIEMAEIKASILAASQKEAAKIRASAEERASRIATDTEMLISQEVSRMADSVRKEVVERIVAEASNIIREKITESDKEKLAVKYLVDIGQKTQSSNSDR